MNKAIIIKPLAALVLVLTYVLVLAIPASAATVTWIGSTDNNLSTGANWDSGAPTNGDSLRFDDTSNNQTVTNDYSSLSVEQISFAGINNGTSSKSYTWTGSNGITVTDDILAIMTGSGGDHVVHESVTLGGNVSFVTQESNTLTIGTAETTLDLGSNDLTLTTNGGTISILGSIVGSGNIILDGPGKAALSADSGSGYTGGLTLPEGETEVNDNLGLPVTLTGGTLKGIGTVGNISMSSGTVAPGTSPGVLNTGDLEYTGGSFDVELGGTASGEFDQTNVTGTVDLGTSTTLNVSLFGGFEPEINDAFVIINNDGTDAVTGNFNGIENGDKVYGDYTYQINYDAGDGNDVVLLITGTPAAPDTGVGSILSNPFATILSALAVLGVTSIFVYSDTRTSNKRIEE